MSELGVILVRVEQRVRAIRLHHLALGDEVRQPPVVGLAGELEHPTRHRHRDPCGGELRHKRVEPFPGRFACDRYAAARRSTSFSCSSSRIRLRASRSSATSERVVPGAAPVSTLARWSHFSEVFRDLLDRDSRLAVLSDAHHVVTELARVRLGHSSILPGRPPGQASSDVTYSCSSPSVLSYVPVRARAQQLRVRTNMLTRSLRRTLGAAAVAAALVLGSTA